LAKWPPFVVTAPIHLSHVQLSIDQGVNSPTSFSNLVISVACIQKQRVFGVDVAFRDGRNTSFNAIVKPYVTVPFDYTRREVMISKVKHSSEAISHREMIDSNIQGGVQSN
jgi:hypothetical protein